MSIDEQIKILSRRCEADSHDETCAETERSAKSDKPLRIRWGGPTAPDVTLATPCR